NIKSFGASITITNLTNVSCFGDSNGSVALLNVSHNFTKWYPLGTNPSKLKAGTYTVTDTNWDVGCTCAMKITITQPAQLIVNVSVVQHGICAIVHDSAFSAVSGGTTPYTYSWSGGHGTNNYVTDLSAGTYTVNVTDHNGCSASALASITQPAVLSVSANTILNVSCNGGSNGSAFSVVSGGGPPYTYSWSGGGGTNANTSGLSAANYTVTVSDSCGNSATASVSITQPNALSVLANTTANVSCNGGNNGSASSIVSGGSSPYTYLWSDGNSQTTISATGLTTGSYTVTVSDFCGSTVTASVNITQPISLSVSVSITSNVSCNRGNNGSAISSISGGTTPYTYTWSNGPNSPDISSLSAGTYSLDVTDNNGCTGSASVIITQPSALNVSANNVLNVSCNGGNNGSASSSVSGGTAPYTYSWSNSQNSPDISSLSAGTYTLNISDNNGCTGSASVIITQPTAMSITADSTNDNGGCNGSAWAILNGGTLPYTYLWTGGGTTDTIQNQCAGNYCITITDASGCIDSACVTINIYTGTENVVSNPAGVVIYPNPNNGQFIIQLSNSNKLSASSQLEIYNMIGEEIYSQFNIHNSAFNIDLTSRANGIYLYRVLSETGNLVSEGKFIIQK
ncbi:MAG TPA: T9SS type A sorting domain-containing protein, partial [Bacteroidia bacterium]|nr:T9SS type A sorting domain-containing protein [Bacteroidia bacterium]